MTSTVAPTLIFYEKPGCSSNQRQKLLLREAGFLVDERNLLTTPWTATWLKSFFAQLPIEDWFNKNAPSIKAGTVNPACLTEAQALAAMLEEPLLIRRPLLEYQTIRRAGFDLPNFLADLNMLNRLPPNIPASIDACSRNHTHGQCRSALVASQEPQQ